jgi:tetratricopeptide (TPR) repeat protein
VPGARKHRLSGVVGAVALLGLAQPATASTIVVGDTSASMCAKAASLGLADEESLRLCSQAIEQSGLNQHDLVATYVNRGSVSMNRRDYASARADFEHAISMDPTAGEAWLDRGAIDIAEHRYRDGIADTTKGIELGVREPAKAYFNRAVAYEGVNDEQDAYLDYQEAMVLQPAWDLPKHELLRFTVVRRGATG